jgi:beta-galactosidase
LVAAIAIAAPLFSADAQTAAPRTTARDEPAGSVVYPGMAQGRSLNGEWVFQLARGTEAAAPDGFPGAPVTGDGWAKIHVPGHWDLQGFIEPQYKEPIPATGFYRRTFEVDQAWKNRRVFLRFEGVLFGFDVCLNGKAVGSWGSAYNPVTFDITDQLNRDGSNTLDVRVTTESFANKFDQNDCWALAGIYRDVWLFALPEEHLRAWSARTSLRDDGTADVVLPVEISKAAAAAGCTVNGTLTDSSGKKRDIVFRTSGPGRFEGTIGLASAQLWHAERPLRHRLDLVLKSKDRVVHEIDSAVALREVRVDGPRLLVNGRPVRLRGVNHHDIWPESGRTATLEQMRRDVRMMVAMNVNFVRTSHYPPDHRFLDLCEEAGLFVMCEVPFGFGDAWLSDPSYTPELLARAAATVRRDIHHGCIIVWSIGNENPVTESTVETATDVTKLDSTRPVCFPMEGRTFFDDQEWGRKIPKIMDIHAPHYPGIGRMEQLQREVTDRPVIMTEFAHSLALGGDGLQSIWDTVLQGDAPAGGALWMFQDQGILRRISDEVKPHPFAIIPAEKQFFDTDSSRGADGLTYSDRVPKTNYWQARAVYAPVRVTGHRIDSGSGLVLTLANDHDLRPLTGMQGTWKLFADGVSTAEGRFASTIQPRSQGEVRIELPAEPLAKAESAWVELAMTDAEDRQVLIDSLALRKPTTAFDQVKGTRAAAEKWARGFIGGDAPAIRLRVGRPDSLLTVFWSDRKKDKANWLPHLLAPSEVGPLEESASGGTLEMSRHFTFVRGDYPEQSVVGTVRCTLAGNGPVRVDYDFEAHKATGIWLEAGLSFAAPEGASELHWIGRGPYATYPGKNLLGTHGRHALHPDDLYFDGNRQETVAALFIGPDGDGLCLLPVATDFDLSVERTKGGVMIGHNARVSGVGTKFTMPDTRVAAAGELAGSFRVLPLTAGNWPAEIKRHFARDRSHPQAFRPYLEMRQ